MNPSWLDHRFSLFESFCLPSVRGQSTNNFKWMLFLDEETPEPYKERIEAATDWPQVKIVYVSDLRQCPVAVLDHISEPSSHLITTTLDNDDAIDFDFVKTVQREFHGQEFEILNFPHGYRFAFDSGRLYRHKLETNPFVTLIEELNLSEKLPLTIRGCGAHDSISMRHDSIRNVESDPMWIQVVHDRNIAATGVWGCRRVSRDILASRFPIKKKYSIGGESVKSIQLENIRRSMERMCINLIPPSLRRGIRRALKQR